MLNSLPPENLHHIFSFLDYFRDVFRHRKLAVPSFNITSEWKVDDFNQMMDLEDSEGLLENISSWEPLVLTCRSFYEAFEVFQPLEITIQMVNGGEKHWARYPMDRGYLKRVERLRLIPIDKQYTEKKEKDENYVMEALERIMKRYEHVFDRVEYVSCFAPLGRNYWTNSGANINVRKFFRNVRHIVANYNLHQVTSSARVLSKHAYFMESGCLDHIERTIYYYNEAYYSQESEINNLKRVKGNIGNRSCHVEIILAYSLYLGRFDACKFIIDNFNLDIGYFQHFWNIVLSGFLGIKEKHLEILRLLYMKNRSFNIFIADIKGFSELRLFERYQFIKFDLKRCWNIELFKSNKTISDFVKEHKINVNKLGKYEFSVLSLDGTEGFISCQLDSPDKFGVTPYMHHALKDLPQTEQQLSMKDNFGNNFLHYFFAHLNGAKSKYLKYSDTNFAKKQSHEILRKLEKEENHLGLTPVEIGIVNGWMNFQFFHNLTFKNFHFKEAEMVANRAYQPFVVLDGIYVNKSILLTAFSGTVNEVVQSGDGKKGELDVNGKHLIHYLSEICSFLYENLLFKPDKNGTMLFQTCVCPLTHLRFDILVHLRVEYPININGYFDGLGFNRIMYYMLKTPVFIERYITLESTVLGFDYSNENDPKMFYITFQKSKETVHFKMESTSIPRITGGFNWYGGEEGDEISHFFIRLCIKQILKGNYGAIELFMNSLITRGLSFGVVKNARGKTAKDILEEFKEQHPRFKSNIYKQVKGSTKSKAVAEFKIKIAKDISKSDIISESATSVIVKNTSHCFIQVLIVRTLYFLRNGNFC